MAIEDVLGMTRRAQNFKTSSKAVDIVGISLEGGFSQILSDARPIDARVTEKASLMKHPLETGASIVDHIVIHPTEIEISFIVVGASFDSVYQQLAQLFRAGTLLSVQTKTDIYRSQVIAELPHEESAKVADGIAIKVKFTEAIMITPEYGELSQSDVQNSAQSSTVQRGAQQTKAVNSQQGAAAKSVYDNSAPAASKGSRLHQWFGS